MVDKTKKSGSQKRGRITEEDIFCVLQRYTATTVLALLQEVGQFEGVKIDWNNIVKKTSTGISSAREYQMLWRHLAYQHSLLDKLNDEDQFLDDDDSDLEYELEAYPEVTGEAEAEAAASVKVLMASGLPNDTNKKTAETVEAPLTSNIPNSCSFRAKSENLQPAATQGMNITAPGSVQKHQFPLVTGSEGKDSDGLQIGSQPSKKKRKQWSDANDLELIAAVRKFGEGNWANIVKSQIMGDRTTTQLSQRWAFIRKKNNLNLATNSRNIQLSEAQQAARHAVNMALDPPTRNTFSNRTGLKAFGNGSLPRPALNESLPAKQEPQKRPAITRYSIMGSMGSASKGASPQPNLTTDPVRAAAVAAGARIVSQSDAASLLKVAQGNNIVHIMPKGSPSIRPTMLTGASTHSETRPKAHHHPSAGVASAPLSTSPTHPKSAPPLTLQRSPPTSLSQPKKISSENGCSESLQERDAKTAGGVKVSSSGTPTAAAVVQENGNQGEQLMDDKTAMGDKYMEGKNSMTSVAENAGPLLEMENAENGRKRLKENDSRRVSSVELGDGADQHQHMMCKGKDENKQQKDNRNTASDDVRSEKTDNGMISEDKEAVKL
ncbi:hypothetical protein LINPERHAP1_LOCUS39372 [Linum perenne]